METRKGAHFWTRLNSVRPSESGGAGFEPLRASHGWAVNEIGPAAANQVGYPPLTPGVPLKQASIITRVGDIVNFLSELK